MDSKKLKKLRDYLEASEAEIIELRKELDSYKKASYGSPIINSRFMWQTSLFTRRRFNWNKDGGPMRFSGEVRQILRIRILMSC